MGESGWSKSHSGCVEKVHVIAGNQYSAISPVVSHCTDSFEEVHTTLACTGCLMQPGIAIVHKYSSNIISLIDFPNCKDFNSVCSRWDSFVSRREMWSVFIQCKNVLEKVIDNFYLLFQVLLRTPTCRYENAFERNIVGGCVD
jgi:hypothetical protein